MSSCSSRIFTANSCLVGKHDRVLWKICDWGMTPMRKPLRLTMSDGTTWSRHQLDQHLWRNLFIWFRRGVILGWCGLPEHADLPPYRGCWYHLQNYMSRGLAHGPKEILNMRIHPYDTSSEMLWYLESTFPILKRMAPYSIQTQFSLFGCDYFI